MWSNLINQSTILTGTNQLVKTNFTNNITQTGGSTQLYDTSIGSITQSGSSVIVQNGIEWNQLKQTQITDLSVTGILTLPSDIVVSGSTYNDDLVLNNATIQQTITNGNINTLGATDFYNGDIRLNNNLTMIGGAETIATLKNLVVQGTSTLGLITGTTISNLYNTKQNTLSSSNKLNPLFITNITSDIQTQLNTKANSTNPQINGTLSFDNFIGTKLRFYPFSGYNEYMIAIQGGAQQYNCHRTSFHQFSIGNATNTNYETLLLISSAGLTSTYNVSAPNITTMASDILLKQNILSSTNRLDCANICTGSVSNSVFNNLVGTTSNIQSQFTANTTAMGLKADKQAHVINPTNGTTYTNLSTPDLLSFTSAYGASCTINLPELGQAVSKSIKIHSLCNNNVTIASPYIAVAYSPTLTTTTIIKKQISYVMNWMGTYWMISAGIDTNNPVINVNGLNAGATTCTTLVASDNIVVTNAITITNGNISMPNGNCNCDNVFTDIVNTRTIDFSVSTRSSGIEYSFTTLPYITVATASILIILPNANLSLKSGYFWSVMIKGAYAVTVSVNSAQLWYAGGLHDTLILNSNNNKKKTFFTDAFGQWTIFED